VIGGIAAIIGHGKPVLVKSAAHEGTHFPGRRDMPCVGRAAEREIHCGTIISPAREQPLVRLERRKLKARRMLRLNALNIPQEQ
jgi:hypothetical protein